jgi:hypothetical protein
MRTKSRKEEELSVDQEAAQSERGRERETGNESRT